MHNIFGFWPGNIYLYRLAFRHRSAALEFSGTTRLSNERLEYLGDAILSAVVADYLFKIFPLREEGFLTEMRSKMVSRSMLNKLSMKLGLFAFIASDTENPEQYKSMLGDAFEAFIGALYLDKGYNYAYRVIVRRIIANHYNLQELETTVFNFKSLLLEWSQREKHQLDFVVAGETGSGHKKQYAVEARVDGKVAGRSTDFSIKGAEQLAAEKACRELGITG